MNQMKRLFIIPLFILSLTYGQVKSIVFDLNGVLFFNKRSFQIKNMGYISIIFYALLCLKNPLQIKKNLFNRLDEAFPKPYDTFPIETQDEEGNTLPYIMDLWLKGMISGKKIINTFKGYLINNQNLKPVEKKILYRLVQLIFNPKLFSEAQYLDPHAQTIITLLKKMGYKIYILSNWAPDSFKIIQEKYQNFFALFDGIIISGECHINKPNKEIYQKLLTTFDLIPSETLFIDDQLINVISAEECGFHAIICPKKGFFGKKTDFKSILIKIKTLSK